MGKRTVVFLGAGASAPFGYPVTAGILPAIWAGLKTNDGPKSWKRWAALKHRKDDAARLQRFLRQLLPGLRYNRSFAGGTSIVDVLSLIDLMVLEGRSPHPALTAQDLLECRRLLNIAINGVLQGRRKLVIAQGLATWILRDVRKTHPNRITLVSTNYDTVVENALFKRLLKRRVSIGRAIDLGMPWRESSHDRIHLRPRDARLALYKLHGSLNWLRCETCGYICVNARQRIASLDFWRRRSKRGYNVCWCLGRLRSLLVAPSIVRDVRDPNLLGIWSAALEDLRMADEWILIGYSLPTEDITIRSLLLRAWHSRDHDMRVRVVQCEPTDAAEPSDTYRRYRMFFPSIALKKRDYECDGVEAFVARLGVFSSRQTDSILRKTRANGCMAAHKSSNNNTPST